LTLATPSAADDAWARATQPIMHERIPLAQGRQCEQRMGPFVTQETAWQRWRQARGQGQAVSQGVVPCYGDGIRGYCFFVFRPC
jgi:anti-sigma factor RsiW